MEENTSVNLLYTASNDTGNTVVSAGEMEHLGQILQQNTRQLGLYFQLNK
jgi:hypothetical protein